MALQDPELLKESEIKHFNLTWSNGSLFYDGFVHISEDGKWVGSMQGAFEEENPSEERKIVLGIEDAGLLRLCIIGKISENTQMLLVSTLQQGDIYSGNALLMGDSRKYLSLAKNVPEIFESFFLPEKKALETLSVVPKERFLKGFEEVLRGDWYTTLENCSACSLDFQDPE